MQVLPLPIPVLVAEVSHVIVAYGSAPKRLLLELREYKYDENVLLFPEFFDSKRNLISRNYRAYFKKVREWERNIIVALWPDYFYAAWPCKYKDIMWVFPLHTKDELTKLPPCITFIGYASSPELRDYDLRWFVENVPRPWWYLGASSKEVYEAVRYRFDGVDVHSLSIPGWGFRDSIHNAEKIALWLQQLARGRVLKRNDLVYCYTPLPIEA